MPEVLVGTAIPGGGGRGRLYLMPHSHHQNDTCIKMGSNESHFNVLLIMRDKVTRRCLQTTSFEERRGEVDLGGGPSAYEPKPLRQGQAK